MSNTKQSIDYNALAKDIVLYVGGKENIETFRHCATRLRFKLIDETKANSEEIKKLKGVMQVLNSMGEYQIVIGNEVGKVYDEVCKLTGKDTPSSMSNAQKKKNIGGIIIDYLGSGLGPFLGAFTAGGIMKGLLVIATMCGVTSDNGLYIMFSAIADTIYYFLPAFLGYSISKKLGSNPIVGFLAGCILCYPTLNGNDITLFGKVYNLTYTSTFLPIMLIMLLVAPLNKWFDAHLPKVIRSFASPLFTLCIAMPIGYFLIGPIVNLLSELLAQGVNYLYTLGALPVAILAGAFWQVLVVFGVHQVLMTACFINLLNGTGDTILAVSILCAFAQSATVAAMAVRSKNKEFRNQALPTVISGIFGTTEPAIYGITLPRIKYFIISCIGGAAAGIICGIFDIRKYSFGSGIFAIPTLINTANPQIMPIVLAVVVSVVVSFVLAFILFKEEDI